MTPRTDCIRYLGWRPCEPAKSHGAQCSRGCRFYARSCSTALIIKLGAPGDVLRTTALLPALNARHGEHARICWLASPQSLPVLQDNPFIAETLDASLPSSLAMLQARKWNAIYCLENSPEAASFCAAATASKKYGFTMAPNGAISPLSSEASGWLSMACSDRLKKTNTRSYQEIMLSICGLGGPVHRPVLKLRTAAAAETAARLRMPKTKLIGLNTGSGSRWPRKMLRPEDSALLCKALLAADKSWRVALLGGPAEKDAHSLIKSSVKNKRLLDTGNANSFQEFAALLAACDCIVCGDTLALHTAAALGVPAVALFGPTSSKEIFSYGGLIRKLSSSLPCLCCYGDCAKTRDCMNALPHDAIVRAAKAQLAFKPKWREP